MSAQVIPFRPLFPAPDAERLLRLCERFGSYGMYGQAQITEELGQGLFQRHDAAMNFIRTGGRLGQKETFASLAVRTNYFRETYAYDQPLVDGIEPFLRYEGFLAGARRLYDRPVICPAIVYANLLVPGQELAIHTDVPEFRGANRTKDPEWLLVVMHHSGLFARWRMPIATAVAWFGGCEGGEFAYYPGGIAAPPMVLPAAHDTAVLLDTDSVFHGVDRVGETRELPPLAIGMRLTYDSDGLWSVGGAAAQPVIRYRWSDLRFSISWKAYCYADERERRMVETHADDLTREQVVRTLIADLQRRSRLGETLPNGTDLALLMIDEYIRFPAPAAAA